MHGYERTVTGREAYNVDFYAEFYHSHCITIFKWTSDQLVLDY